jgi:hypothetical protein
MVGERPISMKKMLSFDRTVVESWAHERVYIHTRVSRKLELGGSEQVYYDLKTEKQRDWNIVEGAQRLRQQHDDTITFHRLPEQSWNFCGIKP